MVVLTYNLYPRAGGRPPQSILTSTARSVKMHPVPPSAFPFWSVNALGAPSAFSCLVRKCIRCPNCIFILVWKYIRYPQLYFHFGL